jgi:carbamoyl-phosphate synthase large subunit
MSSTGEVACFGDSSGEAFLKATYATGFSIKNKGVLFTVGGMAQKEKMLDAAWKFVSLGYTIYTTRLSHAFLAEHHVPSILISKMFEGGTPNVVDVIQNGKVSIVINIQEPFSDETPNIDQKISDGYRIRRAAVEHNVLLLTDIILARFFVKALTEFQKEELGIVSWQEYLTANKIQKR